MIPKQFRSLVRTEQDLQAKEAAALREVERACDGLRRLPHLALHAAEYHGRQEALQRRLNTALRDLAETITHRLEVRAEIETEPLHSVATQPGTRH
ncbi:hypothetical protein [Falsiroseomonas tokyonensis]|uniref:Uncharacterized protein n=1 Tax=Falsiroseomonas tokyonensis TaxID=430521 RepID=A0ABV7BV04_9PROT|nr:hypothetical protein [Falsiroseomonas tokyonensis]MBU8539485.1 hypothetical protein [Falsiroseomonas tokyonensis]